VTGDLSRIWYAHHQSPGDPGYVVVGVAGGAFADGTVVELPLPARRPATWLAEVHVAAAGLVPHRVVVSDIATPGAPALWHVLLPAADRPSEVDLVAFSTADRADGDLLSAAQFETLGIDWGNQVGAMRWDTASGLVRQLYVAPEVRRRGVASKTGFAAVCIVRVQGWAPLRADGVRTDLGEAWVRGLPHRWRSDVPERTSTAPPMTPPAEATGVPERNLHPDPA
jgi:GNAT superfamily N-acetyltransferase